MYNGTENNTKRTRLPEWLKRPTGSGDTYQKTRNILADLELATVCCSAGCPNQGECFSQGTATFMILGEICTRNCQFCRVAHGPASPLSPDEPERVAEAAERLKLQHVVVTSVTRDDIPDGGAEQFAKTVRAIRQRLPNTTIEVLTPDFNGDTNCLDAVCKTKPNVFNHNLETTRRLTPTIRSGADYDRSLGVLRYVAEKQNGTMANGAIANGPTVNGAIANGPTVNGAIANGPTVNGTIANGSIGNGPIVKSGFMVGLGETEEEIYELLRDLRQAGVQIVTIGQYLQPGKENREVQKFYRPDEFDAIRAQADTMGFEHVAAGPFVRSSYHAGEIMSKWVDG